MTLTTRFAPSPTGRLHVGNLRAALQNWLAARAGEGRFLLRIDDTDAARSEERFVDAILADLDWLGIRPDEIVRQSERFALYERHFAALLDAGHIYPCYETAEELDLKRKVRLGRGLPPIYDRAALTLTDVEKARLEADGVRPHHRFRLPHDSLIEWDDLIRGPQRFDPSEMSDPVIRRADGSWLYMLPSVLDDVNLAVTHVLRGEDHVSNTAAQIPMFTAVGGAIPNFAHMALLVGGEGKLSKRLGATDTDTFRAKGIEPLALAALLACIGTSRPVEPITALADLAKDFDFSTFGRAPARFDEDELAAINARTVHAMPHQVVADRLPAVIDAAAWMTIRGNLTTIDDAEGWAAVIDGTIDPAPIDAADRSYLASAAAMAPEIDWSSDPWHALTAKLKSETGRKGKALFLPLRLALTGLSEGPDMTTLLPLIGKNRAVDRLRDAAG